MIHEKGSTKTVNARMSAGWSTYHASMYGVLTAAGMTDLSMADFAGMTGLAFHLYMNNHCDPSGVTVYNWPVRHQNAMDRIGVLTEMYHYEPGTNTYEAARQRAVDNLKAAIDSGVGAVAWAIDTGEFGVIYGYDDDDGIFYVDGVDKFNRDLGSDPMLYENIAKKFPPAPFLHYQIPVAKVPIDLERVYRDSLTMYVDEMERAFHMSPDFHSGLHAYDVWMQSLSDNTYNPFGLRYCTTVYAESKCFAAEYAHALADKWNGWSGIRMLADYFDQIAHSYKSMMNVLEQDWNGGQHLGKPVNEKQAQGMIPHILKAKQLEEQSVQLIKRELLGQ